MNLDNQFKKKFNELDQLCKSVYPNYPNGFDALRQFANSLEGKNKTTLLNLIKARNMNTHDDTNIISFNKESIDFIQGLIDGIKRKYYNGLNVKIDSKIENQRTKNLKIMSSYLESTINKYKFLNINSLNDIRKILSNYINLESKAKNLTEIKKYYFDFINEINLIESRNDVCIARKQKKENNLLKAKNNAINKIESFYAEIINDTTFFNVIIRNKAKLLKTSAITSINRCSCFNELNKIIYEYEEKFYDILDY